jgi:hypothetical protein
LVGDEMTSLDMSKLQSFTPLFPMIIHKYEELIPDQNATILDKVNSIIQSLNQVGKLTNDVVKDWNTVYQWAMNDGLHDNVYAKVDELIANGTIATLLTGLFDAEIGDLSTAKTNAKDKVVNMVNELKDGMDANTTSLAQSMNKTDGIISVLQFGAIGDGFADDTPAIRAANTEASKNGKTIYFPLGYSFKTMDTIQFSNNVNIQMDSPIVYSGTLNIPAIIIGSSDSVVFNSAFKKKLKRSVQ